MEEEIILMKWEAHSSDMKCIENAWGVNIREVYDGGRQFDNIDVMKKELVYHWEKLSILTVPKLVSSMPHRIFELLVKRGRDKSY